MPISDHVRRLRSKVGTDLLLLPSVTVLVRDDEGRILLVRHADNGKWGTVGGCIDVDESPEEAGRREALEETGLEVELTDLVTVLGGAPFRLTYGNGDQAAFVTAVYEARVVGGHARPDDDETTELGWFSVDELRTTTDLGPFARATFEALALPH